MTFVFVGAEEEAAEEDFGWRVSRFQFALPAVVFSFFDQMILIPPVEAARVETWLFVTAVSSSLRNESARVCFISEKAFLASFAALSSCLVGLFLGEKRMPEVESEGRSLGRAAGVLRGEYSSFHSLITSCCQKASMLGR